MISRRQLVAIAVSATAATCILSGHAQETIRFIAQDAHLTADIPVHWSHGPNVPGGITAVGADDGFFSAAPMTSASIVRYFNPSSLAAPDTSETTPLPAIDGLNAARYTIPATDDRQAAVLLTMDNPNPILTTSGEADHLVLFGDQVHFDAIVATLEFGLDHISAPDLTNSILDILEAHAFYSQGVEWEQLRAHVNDLEHHDQVVRFLQSRTLSALRGARDNHSFIVPLSEFANADAPIPGTEIPNLPTGKIIHGYGYLAFPGHNSFAPDYPTDYARRGSELRNELASMGVCGWIVDLRSMGGGSITPLLTVLYPFLLQGRLVGFLDAHENELWITRNGELIDPAIYNIELSDLPWPQGLDDPTTPVAVLTGGVNASAGEFVQLTLMSRQNTTTFGLPTAGQTTGNVVFPLFNGSAFALATTAGIDSQGNIYTSSIDPDVVDPAISLPFRLSDEILAPVYDWLDESCLR